MTRSRRLLSGLPVVGVVVVSIVAHLLFPERPSRLLDAFIHSLHGPGFFVVTIFLFLSLGPRRHLLRRYAKTGAMAMLIGLAAEVAQIPGSRDAQIQDLLVDGIGIIAALAVIASVHRDTYRALAPGERGFIGLIALLTVMAAFGPTAWYGHALDAQNRAMPLLLGFEQRWEASTYGQTDERSPDIVPAPRDWPTPGRAVARAVEDGRHGILIRLHPYPDWRGFDSVSFLAASTTDAESAIDVHIRDMQRPDEERPTRKATVVRVGPMPKRFVIRFDEMRHVHGDRPLDRAHIETLVLSASKPGRGTSVLLDDFRLGP